MYVFFDTETLKMFTSWFSRVDELMVFTEKFIKA